MATDLLINIDHVATLRNARKETLPDPVHAAAAAEAAGADGIVVHLREDRRHITERDVRLLKEMLRTKFDFELSTDPDVVRICCEVQPDLATLVPERREEVTTEHGLDVIARKERLRDVVTQLREAGIKEVALFVDPVCNQIEATVETGADGIELHTGDFANAGNANERKRCTDDLARAAEHAHAAGLIVHAGHGLDYCNYPAFRAAVPHVREVSIGFAVMARAMLVGMEQAVREMRELVKS
ncbi:MAG: pyridoxine 5'-phosphate synthase [Bacteroidetes bacterium SB0662_bin_6]|nr:pyridoxine 5'-phosphate synthase [Bacteroidetes bacterium SB0668_bin_1]MYE05185.1 pyridoxine 5'-phosphate synthase [Bacteroidetes bacterium SB0662_bin_6]